MKDFVINSCYKSILKYNSSYSNEDKEKLLYGLEGLYLTMTKLIVIIFFSLLFHIVSDVFITIVLFNIIRYTGFGFHAEKSSHCLITSMLFFIGLPLIFKYMVIDKLVISILFIISIVTYILYAPADTVKRPIYIKKARIIRKIATIGIASIYYLFILFLPYEYGKFFIIALIIEDIVVNPIFYRIFKQPYNNYKNV